MIGVPSDRLTGRIWGLVCNDIERACDHSAGRLTAADCFERIMARDMQLWVMFEDDDYLGVGVTEVPVYPSLKLLCVVCLGGTGMDHWIEAFDSTMTTYAKAVGCSRVEASVRPGMARKLSNRGYKQVAIVIEREVADEQGQRGRLQHYH